MRLQHPIKAELGPDVLHGDLHAPLMAAMADFNAEAVGDRYAAMAETFARKTRAPRFSAEIGAFARAIGMPTSLREIGIDPSRFDRFAEMAANDPGALANPRRLTPATAVASSRPPGEYETGNIRRGANGRGRRRRGDLPVATARSPYKFDDNRAQRWAGRKPMSIAHAVAHGAFGRACLYELDRAHGAACPSRGASDLSCQRPGRQCGHRRQDPAAYARERDGHQSMATALLFA